MNQIKIGAFIKSTRKEIGLTQAEFAERLSVTDRAVSKWENGKCMPDVSTIPEICEILGISINEFFIGEKITMDETRDKKFEETFISMKRDDEQKSRLLLWMEVLIIALGIIMCIGCSIISEYVLKETWMRLLVMSIAIISLITVGVVSYVIEHRVGYYVCKECGHVFKPKYGEIAIAMHMGRAKKLRCPKCGVKSWSKMYISESAAQENSK